jgi:hypothetical protein
MEFRLLRADEIDVRIGNVGKKTTTMLLYKDARVDMDLLDETVGNGHWQRRHYLVGENLHCEVSVWVDGIGWVAKADVGTESNQAAEKGEASDSFKRACTNWGIGRELYTAKDIRVENSLIEWYEKNGKQATYDTFRVLEIVYDEKRNITGIAIVNQNDRILFSKGQAKKTDEQKKQGEREARVNAEHEREAELAPLRTEYTAKVRQLTGNKGEDAQAYFLRHHKKSMFEVTANAMRQAIAIIDKKLAEADPTT